MPEKTPRHELRHDSGGAPGGPASPPEGPVRPDAPGADARTPRPPLRRRRERPGPEPAACPVCLDHDLAEEEAESAGDASRATDWRVLRTRHRAADH